MIRRATAVVLLPLAILLLSAGDSRGNNLAIPESVPESTRKTIVSAIEEIEKSIASPESESDDVRGAIRTLENAASSNSKVAVIYYYLGIAYQKAEKFSMAKRRLETALRIHPEFHEALVEYGDVFVWLKDYKKALTQYDAALAIAPRYAHGFEMRSLANIRLGKLDDARKDLDAAQAIEKSERRQGLLDRVEEVARGPKWRFSFQHESKNFIVKTSVSNRVAEDIAEQAERIHLAYTKAMPRLPRPDRKYVILVHADRAEYVQNGGPQMAGGHYDPFFRILEIFQHEPSAKTTVVLNHEAFHQFVDDYIDQPPQWFNEGVADYFGAFVYVPEKRSVMSRPNSMRVGTIKQAIAANQYPKPADLMLMSRAEMYQPSMAGIHYAQAWSIIYFIFEGGNRAYRTTLLSYFKALQGGKDIEEAFQATFGRIDMDRFERDWRSFINAL